MPDADGLDDFRVRELNAESSPHPAPAPRGRFLDRARMVFREVDPPTWGWDLREHSDGVEQARSRMVIDLAMRIAASTMATGASASDVTANILTVTRAYGLRSVHVDVTFTAITVTHHRGPYEDPVTMVRTVATRTPDYTRLAETHELIDDIAAHRLPLDEAHDRFSRIMAQPRIYRRSIVTLAFVLMAAGVCTLLGGRPLEIVAAMLIVALVDRVSLLTARLRLPAFFAQIVGGAIPTAVAMGLVTARAWVPDELDVLRPSILVATGIVVLLAGLTAVGAAQDAIDGYYVTASGRAFEVVILTLGIVVGVLTVITIAFRLGVPSYMLPPAGIAQSTLVQIIAVALIAAGFSLGGYSGLRTVAVSCAVAVVGWFGYLMVGQLGFGTVAATAFACTVVGLLTHSVAIRLGVPALAVTTAGIVAFLPGSMIYRGLYYLTEPDMATLAGTSSATHLWGAAATGLAIAGGVSLGSYFGRLADRNVRAGVGAAAKALARSRADNRE
ncbi:threonine/serine ThrE exporter family protein [Enemella sp. A6]|uniref:threonine/serine ThrE exporter family protein n=1 Tax=Enemella sp. A6 TaxID=3440152 RepID=UPI003EBF5BAC